MIPIAYFKGCMKRERFDEAGLALRKIIDDTIGHINNKPALEIEFYGKNWTTVPFGYLVSDLEGGFGTW